MVVLDHLQSDAFFGSAVMKDPKRAGRLWRGESQSSTLHDPSFVPCYLFDGIAEHSCVIYPQACDAGNSGPFDNVGTIILPTYPTLNDGGVHAFAQEGVKGHECEEAEVYWLCCDICWQAFPPRCVFQTIPCLEEVFGKQGFRKRLVIQLYAFTDKS